LKRGSGRQVDRQTNAVGSGLRLNFVREIIQGSKSGDGRLGRALSDKSLSIRFLKSEFEGTLILNHNWSLPWIVESAGDIDSKSLLKVIQK
jgi:hypothetical protein